MALIQSTSSVVLVGEGFHPGLFDYDKFSAEYGPPDLNQMVRIPILSQMVFPKSEHHVRITPEKIELSYGGLDEVLPELLLNVASSIVDNALASSPPQGMIRGVGINYTTVSSMADSGTTGKDFCEAQFLVNRADFLDRLKADDLIGIGGKITFHHADILFNVNIEPHFQSNLENLVVNINGHQDVEDHKSAIQALQALSEIRDYSAELLTTLIGSPN